MSGQAGFSDDFHQRVLFNLFNSSLNQDHASSQHGGVMKRNATPKSGKRRSEVWNNFKLDIKPDGKEKAICNHCNKELVGESKKGTSHLLNHQKICPEKRSKVEDENKPFGNGNLMAHVVTSEKSKVDLELSSLDLTRSAINRGWKTFMDDLLHVYGDERQKLCKSFTKLSCRFSLAVDKFAVDKNHSYLFFRVYYIDENWEMKRNIWFLQQIWTGNFTTPAEISHLNIELCSTVWPNNDDRDKYMELCGDILGRVPYGYNFKNFVSLEGYIDYVSGGKGVGSVSDIIKNMLGYDLFEKVDKAFTYVKRVLYDNDKHDLLTEIRVNLTEKEGDMSYFRTMTCVLEYKEAFLELEHIDCAFKLVSLNRKEWEVLTAAYECLKVLNDVTCSLSRNKYGTANLCIHLIRKMYETLLQLGANDSNPNSYTQKIASSMRYFIEDYWKGNSLVLSIAAVLDPRFKMDLVRGWYKIIYPKDVEVHISRFVDELRCIYNCYANVPDNPTSSVSIPADILFGILELDSYLGEKPSDLPIENREILAWWRNSTPRFPTLARMARDFLAVPICEVSSDTKDDIMKMLNNNVLDEFLAFEWTKCWLQYSHHEDQSLENPPSYHGQGITKTRQGNASSNCEMVSHTVRHNASNTPHPKQTPEYWSKLWKECDLTLRSGLRGMTCYDCGKNLTAEERPMHYRLCPAQRFFKERENLGPFRRSDLTTLVDTKKKFKVDCELDGSHLARMTLKLGHMAFADDLLRVYKEEKQKAIKYLNKLSCSISLEVSVFNVDDNKHLEIITVQFIDEVWKLQRKILCLDAKWEWPWLGEFHCIGISPQELNAGRNLCSIVYPFDHPECSDDEDINDPECSGDEDINDPECSGDEDISHIKRLFHDPVFFPSSSGNFRAIQSLRSSINEFISYKGRESVRHKMENILGFDIFEKIKDCYRHAHKKLPHNDKFGEKNSIPDPYDHQSWGIALEFRETFLKLEGTELDLKEINLTNKEWDALTAGYNCLKVFKDVTSEHLSGKEYTTANVCLPLICDIYKRLQGLHLIYGNNDICQFAPHLKESLVKGYWDKNGLALTIAAVLDPRFKMDVVREWYNLIYNDEAEVCVQGFIKELRKCYNRYGDGPELDRYLCAPKHSRYVDFGILTWWRDSTSQFPTLAQMARDILAIPVWSDNSAIIDEIQKMWPRLKDLDILNAFICTASWLESLKDK